MFKDDFKNNKCSCDLNGCSKMGYHADINSVMGSHYLLPNNNSPYCKF